MRGQTRANLPIGQGLQMESTAEFYCAFCGEPNTTFVDMSAGLSQTYIEDCQVCCRPNQLYVTVDEVSLTVDIATDYAG